MAEIDDADHLTGLRGLQSEFQRLLLQADPEIPVLSCGSWTVRELAEHLGSVHVWAAGRVLGERVRVDASSAFSQESDPGTAVVAHYAASAQLLREALAAVPADHRCQTLIGEGPASFWSRRQSHETLIHLWDLSTALGAAMPNIEQEIWADCVDEVVTVMHPRQIQLDRVAAPELPVRLIALDAQREWQLASAPTDSPSAVISGQAAELALLLWGRRDLEDLSVSGDRSRVESMLATALTP